MSSELDDVAALVRSYYGALETGAPLPDFYATDEEAGAFGPPVKVGSGKGEFFAGYEAIAAEVQRVSASFGKNRVESRRLLVRPLGERTRVSTTPTEEGASRPVLAWFADQVWWSGEDGGRPFASLTRWTGLCLHTTRGWKFLQLHVSEEA